MAIKKKTRSKTSTNTNDIRSRLLAAEKQIGSMVMEREEPVRGMLLSLLTRQHLLLFGPPGTAKSMLTDLAQKLVQGAERFSLLLTRTTLPDELFGMWDVSGISKGLMERLDTGGTMRSAHIAFLDEVFKSNSTTLNSLLGALNERKFRNGTAGEVTLPLISCVGASNEYPQGEDLGALYDRFLLRYWINPLGEERNWISLLTQKQASVAIQQITLGELEAAQQEVARVQLPLDLSEPLLKVRSALGQIGITASDRRWYQAMSVVRAQAWLDGRDVVDKGDLIVLQHALWNNFQDEGRKVSEVMLGTCAPKLKDLLAVMDLCHEQVRIMREYSHREDVTRAEIREAKAKFSELKATAESLIPDAGPAGSGQGVKLQELSDEAAKLHAKAVW